MVLGIDLGVAFSADLPGDLLWADHHALWAQVISNCAFGEKKSGCLNSVCKEKKLKKKKRFPWFILFVPCATVGCHLLPASCTFILCWLPVESDFFCCQKCSLRMILEFGKILLVTVGEACYLPWANGPQKLICNVHVHFLRIWSLLWLCFE